MTASAPPILLTTRPADDAAEDIAALAKHGITAIPAPMLAITAIAPPPLLPDVGAFDAIAFTSRHAIANIGANIMAEVYTPPPAFCPAFCVGAATAAAAREAGFTEITIGKTGDAAGLADAIIAATPKPKRLFWPSGKHVSDGFDFAAALTAQGIEVTRLAVYEAVKTTALGTEIRTALADAGRGIALIYSARAGENLAHLLEAEGLAHAKARLTIIAASARVAGLCGGGWHTIKTADAPTRPAMLEAAIAAMRAG